MTSTTLALLLGALLVFAGILGGGFEIKELKVPKIGAFTRFLSVSVGIFFILVGIILENESVFNLVSETFNKEQAEVSTPSTGEDLNNNPPVVPLPRYVSKPGDSSGYSAVAHCTRTGVTGKSYNEETPEDALAVAIEDCIDKGGVPTCCKRNAELLY